MRLSLCRGRSARSIYAAAFTRAVRPWVLGLGRPGWNLHTLVWTRGAGFPISQLDSRLKFPCVALVKSR